METKPRKTLSTRTMFWPKIILMAGLAGVFIGLAIRDWRGNVTRMLLLRLLDAQQKKA